MEGASRETSPLQCFRSALAGTGTPARVRRDLALLVPGHAILAAVLSLRKRGNSTFIVARNAYESNDERCSGSIMRGEKGGKIRLVSTISREGMRGKKREHIDAPFEKESQTPSRKDSPPQRESTNV
jgi:hypothetical protein